jgi:hypothetical protein
VKPERVVLRPADIGVRFDIVFSLHCIEHLLPRNGPAARRIRTTPGSDSE